MAGTTLRTRRCARLPCMLCALLASACGGSGNLDAGAPAQPPVNTAVPDYPQGAVARQYFADGPWDVVAKPGFACCDTSGNKFDIWYPAAAGRGGFRHPIITWGDGSDAVPAQYAALLRHLASWGFVVVASETQAAHSGQEMIDAARYVAALDDDPSSPLYGKLAVDRIGAMGHSQGSGGAVLALMHAAGFIRTAVPIEHPEQLECSPGDCPSMAGISAGSVFFVNGSADTLISPSTQAAPCALLGVPDEQSDACFYAQTPDRVEKTWGTVVGPDHNDVQGQPACAPGAGLCNVGVYGYLGYPTVWMVAQLMDDAQARQVFLPGGEFFNDGSWGNQASNLH